MPVFITREHFVRHFPTLVLDQRTLPRRRVAIETLLVGVMAGIDTDVVYDESEINTKLQAWIDAFGESLGWDRVALRRLLVDEGFLQRDAFGTAYMLRARTPVFGYDPSIRDLDLRGLVDDLAQQRAERKQAFADQDGP